MLYNLFHIFHTDYSWLNVFRYITFRSILSALSSLILVFLVGEWMITKLRDLQIGQYIREDGPPNHQGKAGTPTMGGCLILPTVILCGVLWAELSNIYVWLVLFVMICFGLIGFTDDLKKLKQKNGHGLTAKSKIILQIIAATIVAITLYFYPDFDTHLNLPFFKSVTPDLGVWYIPLAIFIIVGSSTQ